MKQIIALFKKNKSLFGFMLLSYFDKAVIFVLPIMVLQLFKNQTVYLSIEYIYSITILIIPFLDLGLVGYFYYIYRKKTDKRAIVQKITKIFHLIYIGCFSLGLILILVHYLIIPIDNQIIYIVTRAIFMATFAFLSSYYRLINKPHKVLFVTISANVISLLFLFLFVSLGFEFKLWLIFIGQILFCLIYFFKTIRLIIFRWSRHYKRLEVLKVLKAALLFSWPTILQVFIMMYIANYGKINALDKMTLDDGTLLSLIQRFSMLIQITHTSVLAFMIKDMYSIGSNREIKKGILYKYLTVLTGSTFLVLSLIGMYFSYSNLNLINDIYVLGSIILYTYFWSISSYLEVYYSRENKNILKLYLAITNGLLFVFILFIAEDLNYLDRIATAMILSTVLTLLLSILILRRRKYYLS